jgi:YHS domain-containing protein
MNARYLLATLAVALVASSALITAKAEEADKGENEFAATCPVSGEPAEEEAMLKIGKDLKVYFCCDDCRKGFKKDPKKFDMQARRQLLETKQMVQVACPITGKPVNEKTMVDVGETKAGFCCKNCLAKYEKADDEGKLAILFADLPKGFTRQTKCPVSGKPIDALNPKAAVQYEGKEVYFCCPNCPKAFTADPAKFTKKLPQFTDKDQGLPATAKKAD